MNILWTSVQLLCTAVLAEVSAIFNGSYSHEFRLMTKLFRGYDTTVRPRFNSADTVGVQVRFSLQQIYDLDEKRQVLTISGWLTAEWKDEFLTWDPRHFGGIKTLVVDPKKLWTPQLAIGNSADRMFHAWKHFWITVRHTGFARWQPGGNFAFTCALDMNYYPFDQQQCTMEVETWYYTSEKVNLTNSMDEFGLETYLSHGEWAMVATTVTRDEKVYSYYTDEAFPEIYFTVHLQRKYTFYFMYILLPCIMLSFVLLMIFLLPAESGEKVSLGVSILVSFSLFLIIVAEQVPDTSDAVPVMAIYLMYFMMATSLSIMGATLVLKLHYRGFDSEPPTWLRFVIFDLVAACLCLGSLSRWSRNHRDCIRHDIAMQTFRVIGEKTRNGDCLRSRMTVAAHRRTVTFQQPASFRRAPSGREADGSYRAPKTLVTEEGRTTVCNLAVKKHISLEWQKISEVLDRFFFWIFLVFILIPLVSLAGFVRVFKPVYHT